MNLKLSLTTMGAAASLATTSGCNNTEKPFLLPENLHTINKSIPSEAGAAISAFIASEARKCISGDFSPEESRKERKAALGEHEEKVDIVCREGTSATILIDPKSICPQALVTRNGTEYVIDPNACAAGY